jgi:hypothetical protein
VLDFNDLDMEILKTLQKKNLGVIATFPPKVDRAPLVDQLFFQELFFPR